jgi:hypothetical protein
MLPSPNAQIEGGDQILDPSRIINGSRVYRSVLHGSISGTVYLDPSLGIELPASGSFARRVVDLLAPSLRHVVLEDRTTASIPSSWRLMSFAGLRFAVPPPGRYRDRSFRSVASRLARPMSVMRYCSGLDNEAIFDIGNPRCRPRGVLCNAGLVE